MGERLDIYIVSEVESLKEDYRDLLARWEEVVNENARLEREIDRLRQRVREEDWSWMNG